MNPFDLWNVFKHYHMPDVRRMLRSSGKGVFCCGDVVPDVEEGLLKPLFDLCCAWLDAVCKRALDALHGSADLQRKAKAASTPFHTPTCC